MFCDTNTIHNLDPNDMRDLLTLAAYESLSIFDQVMYRQIDGVTMGSSWVRFLRMQFSVILKNWFSECSPNILHILYKIC